MFTKLLKGMNSGEAIVGTREIVDLMNLIGKCVVSGNIRRTAEIAFGEYDDKEFISLKNYKINPERTAFGWVSNNSIFARLGQDYTEVSKRIIENGEPGLAWLENMRAFGRMAEPADHKDRKAAGGNPCLEQTLESHEMCCLVETFPDSHKVLADFKDTLELALLYAKSVTLAIPGQWPKSGEVMERNRRIGTSMSGIAQFISKRGV